MDTNSRISLSFPFWNTFELEAFSLKASCIKMKKLIEKMSKFLKISDSYGDTNSSEIMQVHSEEKVIRQILQSINIVEDKLSSIDSCSNELVKESDHISNCFCCFEKRC